MLRCLVSRVTCHAVWGRSYVTTTQLAGVLLSDAQLLEIIQPLLSYREIKDNLSSPVKGSYSYKIHVRKNSIFINNFQKTFWICLFWLSKACSGRIYQFIANNSKPLITTSNIRSLGVISKTPNVRHQVHIITHLSSISGDRASDSSDPRHLDNPG